MRIPKLDTTSKIQSFAGKRGGKGVKYNSRNTGPCDSIYLRTFDRCKMVIRQLVRNVVALHIVNKRVPANVRTCASRKIRARMLFLEDMLTTNLYIRIRSV